MKFIGRLDEQKAINYALDREGYQGYIIYGRRRLGKTALIKHCLETRTCRKIFFQCSESSEEANTQALSKIMVDTYDLHHLAFNRFDYALEYIFKASCSEETILVIDEYPYIRSIIPGCDSRMQRLIDEYQNKCHLKLFILGSSISTMEELFSYSCPLFQRLQNSLLLKQMDYYDSSLFYESFSNEDKITLYAVFGGVPFYNAQINPKETVKENIIRILSSHFSGLKDFIEIYLKGELRKINNANTVFETIALGSFHYKDILNKSYISSPLLTSVLDKLIKMDLIKKVSPINEPTNKQKSGYIISDATVKFYYNFIYRNISMYEVLDDEVFYDHYIKDALAYNIVPHTFELVTKEYLIRCNGVKTVTPLLVGIGKYWYDDPINHTHGQFDVVGQTDEGYIFFECKYTDTPITDGIIKEEIAEVGKTTLKAYQYGFVSKVGFDLKNKYNYVFITLEDMYK